MYILEYWKGVIKLYIRYRHVIVGIGAGLMYLLPILLAYFNNNLWYLLTGLVLLPTGRLFLELSVGLYARKMFKEWLNDNDYSLGHYDEQALRSRFTSTFNAREALIAIEPRSRHLDNVFSKHKALADVRS